VTRTKRFWQIMISAIVLLASMPILRVVGERFRADAGVEAYRYRFERAARGSARAAVEREIEFYQNRLRVDPNSGLTLASLGGVYLKMARATGDLSWYLFAEQAARRAHTALPFNNDGAIGVLARVAEARHDFTGAIALADRLDGSEEALSILVTSNLGLGRVDGANDAANRLVERSPTLGGHTLRALARLAAGRDAEAVADFDRAIAAEEPGEAGGSALARAYLGRFHARRGRVDEARALYREALRILPQHSLTLVLVAELEARVGDYGAAGRHYAEVVDVSSASPNVFDHVVLRGIARIKALRNDAGGAGALWRDAEARLRRDLASSAFGHRRELARLLLERGRSADVPEALSLMEAEARARGDADTLDTYAWALTRAGRWADARTAVHGAMRWGVRDAGLYYRAAMIEQTLGAGAAARRFFDLAHSTDRHFDEQARRAAGLGF
jgi:tetratricopeptide (TPR) repeat protein